MTRVLVGMSGGVDSSVAATMLAQAGHDVIGVSLQLYDHSDAGRIARCCSPEDFLDARRVASQFGFPYYVVNQEEVFSRNVLDYFVDEYRRGRTPNPCVRCNGDVKFEALGRLAVDLGATQVATGHYARLDSCPTTGRRRLLRALDAGKDQSYFLFDLTQEQLSLALFPLGELTKEDVRREAEHLGLATAGKPESQDVCFVEGGDYREFLRRRSERDRVLEQDGDIVDSAGRVLGAHHGLSGFTVGQRRGLGVSASRRLYVVSVEADTRRVVLGDESELSAAALTLTGVTWLGSDAPGAPFETLARVRYRHAGVRCLVVPAAGGTARLTLLEPQRGISPGQAAVFYDGDVVLGGGWIDQVERSGVTPAARLSAGKAEGPRDGVNAT